MEIHPLWLNIMHMFITCNQCLYFLTAQNGFMPLHHATSLFGSLINPFAFVP